MGHNGQFGKLLRKLKELNLNSVISILKQRQAIFIEITFTQNQFLGYPRAENLFSIINLLICCKFIFQFKMVLTKAKMVINAVTLKYLEMLRTKLKKIYICFHF